MMTTMNRYYRLNSESRKSALLIKDHEQSLVFMRSLKDKHKRFNSVEECSISI